MHKVPRNALLLGLAGLLPLVAAALAVLILDPWAHPLIRFAAQVYGALILSFLGGVHWGLAMAAGPAGMHGARLAWSVVPSLVGWPALFLPPVWSLAVLIVTFGILGIVDTRLARHGTIPGWYGPLRRALTLAVILCLAVLLANRYWRHGLA